MPVDPLTGRITPEFDPRYAALRYAAGRPDETNAIVCALVYVGDALTRIRLELRERQSVDSTEGRGGVEHDGAGE